MIRKIVHIDEEKCTGCGLCADACHEGAIIITDGKAKLLRDDFCDGFGDCLPACPADAIQILEREAAAYDEAAVIANKEAKAAVASLFENSSKLGNWPVQLKLAPTSAPYFNHANLLIAADCTAYAYGDFHNQFIRNRVTVIGCPKLDEGDYSEKLTRIIRDNDIKSVTIVRMQVPCCKGIENAAKKAIQASGKFIPWQVVVISSDGKIIES